MDNVLSSTFRGDNGKKTHKTTFDTSNACVAKKHSVVTFLVSKEASAVMVASDATLVV